MGIKDFKKHIRELEKLYEKCPGLRPSRGKVIGDLITFLFAVGFASFVVSIPCRKSRLEYNLRYSGELVHEEKYVVEGESYSSTFWGDSYNFSATQIGKNNLSFFDPSGDKERLNSSIDKGDTLTMRLSEKQKKYLDDKSGVFIRYENIKDINGKRF